MRSSPSIFVPAMTNVVPASPTGNPASPTGNPASPTGNPAQAGIQRAAHRSALRMARGATL